jgi:hypothetical protein
MSERTVRRIGWYAAAAAVAAVVLAPLLALSWFATEGGSDTRDDPTVAAWADPARAVLEPLLTWASADRVYATYVQAFALLFPAVLLCALAVRSRYQGPGRFELWAWRVALAGYGLSCAAIFGAFVVLFAGERADAALNVVYLALMLPSMLLGAVGSTLLGIALLRNRRTPRATGWLLALTLPAAVVLPEVLGHNSLGDVPLFVAWGIAGLHLLRHPSASSASPAGRAGGSRGADSRRPAPVPEG